MALLIAISNECKVIVGKREDNGKETDGLGRPFQCNMITSASARLSLRLDPLWML
jgi:hypothetical protein